MQMQEQRNSENPDVKAHRLEMDQKAARIRKEIPKNTGHYKRDDKHPCASVPLSDPFPEAIEGSSRQGFRTCVVLAFEHFFANL
jgi:hypothetical protein